jgi:hypothetical protein
MVDLDNWLVGNPLVIPKFDPKKQSLNYSAAAMPGATDTRTSQQPPSAGI